MNDGLLQQLAQGDFLSGKPVVLLADAHKGLPAQAPAVVVVFIEIALHNGKIQAVFIQQMEQALRIVHDHRQRIALLLQISLDLGIDDKIPDGFGGTHTQLIHPVVAKLPPDIRILTAHGQGVLLQHLGGGGFQQVPVLVGKQLAPILPLQELNMLGYGRLGYVQHFRRLVIAQSLAQGKKGIHPIIQHRRLPSITNKNQPISNDKLILSCPHAIINTGLKKTQD